MRKILQKILPKVSAWVNAEHYDELQEEYDRKLEECKQLAAKNALLIRELDGMEKDMYLVEMDKREAESQAREYQKGFWLLFMVTIAIIAIVAITIACLCTRPIAIGLAGLDTTHVMKVVEYEGEAESYDYMERHPEVLYKASCLDTKSSAYVDTGGELYLMPRQDYRLDIYVLYGNSTKFGSDITVELPKTLPRWQSQQGMIYMSFGDRRMFLDDLGLITTKMDVGIRDHYKTEVIDTIFNNRTAVQDYLTEAGFEASDYTYFATGLSHYSVSFSTVEPRHTYTWTSHSSAMLTDVMMIGLVVTIIVVIVCSVIVCLVANANKEVEEDYFDDEDDMEEDEEDAEDTDSDEGEEDKQAKTIVVINNQN